MDQKACERNSKFLNSSHLSFFVLQNREWTYSFAVKAAVILEELDVAELLLQLTDRDTPFTQEELMWWFFLQKVMNFIRLLSDFFLFFLSFFNLVLIRTCSASNLNELRFL